MPGTRSFLLFLFSISIFGCATFEKPNKDVTPPTLIEKTAFPPPPSTVTSKDFYLKLELLIGKDGSVMQVELENSSGDAKWDSMAVQSILHWKYSPAMLKNKPIQLRISQNAHIIYFAPVMMSLSEIVCSTAADADSVYVALQAGKGFDSLARKFSIFDSKIRGGYLGEVDIHRFPEDIQAELQKLKPGEYTNPLPLGSFYAIYKKQYTAKSMLR